jgi:EAL domain-containing protein (putative c-di-GMP-specific phosphodiesterase class I)
VALGNAVQVSGLGDRIGMDETPEIAKRKVLDYFFALKENHHVEFQPIVDLRTMQAHEWECLFRPHMPMLPQTISSIVDAALVAKRPSTSTCSSSRPRWPASPRSPEPGPRPAHALRHQPPAGEPPGAALRGSAFADRVRRVGLSPRQIVVECTEQQAIADIPRLKKQVRALRRLGFGFAIDDAGAGYASFNVIAALEPSIIKIDREIVSRIGNKDSEAKKALVEAFVSFSRRIGAKVVAEGIENRRDLSPSGARGRLRAGLPARPVVHYADPAATSVPSASCRWSSRRRAAGRGQSRPGPPPASRQPHPRPFGGTIESRTMTASNRNRSRSPPPFPQPPAASWSAAIRRRGHAEPGRQPAPGGRLVPLEGDAIVFNSRVGRQWPTNLERDPRVSITVADGYDYVEMRGDPSRSTRIRSAARPSSPAWRAATRRTGPRRAQIAAFAKERA